MRTALVLPFLLVAFPGFAAGEEPKLVGLARIPAAAGLYNFARITAGSFGTSIITTLWDRRATLHHSHLVEALGANPAVASQALGDLQARGFDPQQSYGMLNRLVDQQAFMLSANDLFLASGVLFVVMIFLSK